MRGEGRSSAFGQTDSVGGWAERRGTNDDRRVPRWSAVIGRAGVGPDGGMHLSDGGTLGWGAMGAMHAPIWTESCMRAREVAVGEALGVSKIVGTFLVHIRGLGLYAIGERHAQSHAVGGRRRRYMW